MGIKDGRNTTRPLGRRDRKKRIKREAIFAAADELFRDSPR